MDIDSLTIGQVKELNALLKRETTSNVDCSEPDLNLLIGRNIFIRGANMYYVGTLTTITHKFLGISDAAWVADTGRFHTALATGIFNEVEPYPPGLVLVSRNSICDICVWKGTLPVGAK